MGFWCIREVFMKDERSLVNRSAAPRRPLEERLAQRPALLARLHELADHLDQSVADGSDAHRAEEWVRVQLRQLGQEVLSQWAVEANAHAQAQVPAQHPQASGHGKKNF
jgi:hypothetical protein